MMIEQTLMKVGKSPGGLKGVTLKPEVVKKVGIQSKHIWID